jgi:hypothetical protein
LAVKLTAKPLKTLALLAPWRLKMPPLKSFKKNKKKVDVGVDICDIYATHGNNQNQTGTKNEN